MRWKNITTINESVAKYKPMFTNMFADGKVSKEILTTITRVEQIMKREDRVVWALRWYRLYFLHGDMTVATDERLNKLFQRYKRETINGNVDDNTAYQMANDAIDLINDMPHYLSMPIHGITNYVFAKQTPAEIKQTFSDMEEEWRENQDHTIDHDSDTPTMLIDFRNGWAWFDLERTTCRTEGNVMGHCGNTGSPSDGETILSLRKHVEGDLWSPHLTFILDRDGWLGEMKGRANDKPAERYHRMIIALLKNPKVVGIKGGGHAPEANFALDDLSYSEEKELVAAKPGLNGLHYLYRTKNWEVLHRIIKEQFRNADIRIAGFDGGDIILGRWDNVASIIDDYTPSYDSLFEEITERLNDENLGSVADSFHIDYYESTWKENWHDLMSFQYGNEHFDFEHGKPEIRLDIQSYIADVDSGEITPDQLLSVSRGTENESNLGEYVSDPIELLILQSIYDRLKIPELIYEIKSHYTTEGGTYSPTSNDPRQLRFDF